jgi:hypothetical protein
MMPYNDFEEGDFEEGDIVECVMGRSYGPYAREVGERYVVTKSRTIGIDLKELGDYGRHFTGNDPTRFKLHKKKGDVVGYEDKWHLNDGSVEIPEGAEKLMNPEGTSVVAYRLVKKPDVKTFIRFVCPDPRGYMIESYKYHDAIAKLTFITTDGELTDIQWEKI